jgi:hypothetical protein
MFGELPCNPVLGCGDPTIPDHWSIKIMSSVAGDAVGEMFGLDLGPVVESHNSEIYRCSTPALRTELGRLGGSFGESILYSLAPHGLIHEAWRCRVARRDPVKLSAIPRRGGQSSARET